MSAERRELNEHTHNPIVRDYGNNPRIMGEHTNGFWLNLLGWTAAAAMTGAASAFFVMLGR